MPKLVYRGVEHKTEDKGAVEHSHGKNLRYRGTEYDGYEAEKAAERRGFLSRLIYRGVKASRRSS